MVDIGSFTFSPVDMGANGGARVVDVPPSLATKDELVSTLGRLLGVPDHFGSNWDALDESLRDLSWVPEHTVIIRHAGVPTLPVDVVRMYFSVLARGAQSWRGSKDHELLIAFPPAAREEVMLIARGPVPGLDREESN
jgi:hypothetical protein